jgi:DNA-binding transcriptional ArsR family regulator
VITRVDALDAATEGPATPRTAATPGTSVTDDIDVETVARLLADDVARTVLAATSEEPMSAAELQERCDASLATVTRRLEELTDADLLSETTRPRADGHHDTVYAPTLERLEIELDDGEFRAVVDRRERDAADRLTDMWRNL